jgi:hypothetical protein
MNPQNIFNYSIQTNNLDELIKIYQTYDIDIHYNKDEAFEYSCIHNYLNIAKWLYEKSKEKKSLFDIYARDDYRCSLFRKCCRSSECGLDVIIWLYELSLVEKLYKTI